MNSKKISDIFRKVIEKILPLLLILWAFLFSAYIKYEKEASERRAIFERQEAQRKAQYEFQYNIQQTLKNVEKNLWK